MKDKRSVKQKINRLRRLKTWQLVVILVFMMLMSATFLRLNNIGMVQRQKAVEQADKQVICRRCKIAYMIYGDTFQII